MKEKLGLKKMRVFMFSFSVLILILGLSLGLVLKHKNGGGTVPGTPGIPGTPTTPATPKPKPPSPYPGAKRTLTVTSNFTNMTFYIHYLDYQGHNATNTIRNSIEVAKRGEAGHGDNYIDSTKWSKDQIASQSAKSVIPEIFATPYGNETTKIHTWNCNFKFIPSGQQGGVQTIPVDVNLFYIYETTVVDGNTNLGIAFYVGDQLVGQRSVPESKKSESW